MTRRSKYEIKRKHPCRRLKKRIIKKLFRKRQIELELELKQPMPPWLRAKTLDDIGFMQRLIKRENQFGKKAWRETWGW